MRYRVAKKIYRREFACFSVASSDGDSRFNRYVRRAWAKDRGMKHDIMKQCNCGEWYVWSSWQQPLNVYTCPACEEKLQQTFNRIRNYNTFHKQGRLRVNGPLG